MAGSVKYQVDGIALTARAGELLVLPPGSLHQLTDASSDVILWVMELQLPNLPQWTQQLGILSPSSSWTAALVACARKLWLRPPAPQISHLESQLWELLHNFEPVAAASLSPLHPAVQKARAICEQELTGKLDMGTLARRSGISPSRLAHLFQAQLGVTPLQYKNFVRLQHFIQVRRDGDISILREALRAGFGSYPQFHRVFHQVCGAPPKAHFQWLSGRQGIDARRTVGSS